MNESEKAQQLRRWRLILGGGAADGTQCRLNQQDGQMDNVLSQLYGDDSEVDSQSSNKRGGLESSAPKVARWLGDIRSYFPNSVVKVMQKDAIERFGLQGLIMEPDILASLEADVHLVATLVSLRSVMPERTKETARQVVNKVVEKLLEKLSLPMQQAIRGSLNRAIRNNRPRYAEIDWLRTIKANLKHYQPEYRTIVPEKLIGYGRKQKRSFQDIVLCVDQSGSMASSVVYASIFAAVMASIPAVTTRLVAFDTAIVDLTDDLHDPVDVLFGIQLGGGTDINRAVTYCETRLERPQETVFILITDLYEGGNEKALLKRVNYLVQSGVQFITLLALNDEGASWFNHRLATAFAELQVPTFACTPDQFPDLMAAALQKQDIQQWAASQNIVLSRANSG